MGAPGCGARASRKPVARTVKKITEGRIKGIEVCRVGAGEQQAGQQRREGLSARRQWLGAAFKGRR